jgi:hypothetical protein
VSKGQGCLVQLVTGGVPECLDATLLSWTELVGNGQLGKLFECQSDVLESLFERRCHR